MPSERRESRDTYSFFLPNFHFKEALVPVPAIDPIYDNYDVPLTMDDNDERQNLSLRGQISELERVIQLKDEQIRMKEERAAIKEQQIEELKVEMAAQYESDGKKIAWVELVN